MVGRNDRIHFLLTVTMLVFLVSCDSGAPEAPADSTVRDAVAPTNDVQPSSAVDQPRREVPERQVVSDRLPYAEVDEELVYGHFVFPADMVRSEGSRITSNCLVAYPPHPIAAS